MNTMVRTALAVLAVACLAQQAQAGCVISPDGKSIDVVTDNGASEEKNCAVKCQVDTKIGVAQVSCGGNTPPLARGHSLCGFSKPEAYYKKVLSSEDSCKATPAAAAVVAPMPAPLPAGTPDKPSFICRIAPDGQSAEAVVLNPYAQETHCQIDCQVSTTRGGTTFSMSCSKTAAVGGETVLCKQNFERGRLVKMVGGKASCVSPLVPAADEKKDKDDDDDDIDQDEILRRMQRGEKMENWLKKK